MAEFARIKVTGASELRAHLERIGEALKDKALRAATFAGADAIRNEAVRLAPVWTGPVSQGHPPPGTLKNSIIVKRITEKCRPYSQTYFVTVRRGPKGTDHDAYYALWVEYGHYAKAPGMTPRAHRQARLAGALPGAQWVPARPFMRPAFEALKAEALEIIKAKLIDEILRA